jgi:hypothetical protein
MFPRITNGKVYLPFGGTTPDGIDVDGMYELSPEDPSYEATKAWLIQVERGEWSLTFGPSSWAPEAILAEWSPGARAAAWRTGAWIAWIGALRPSSAQGSAAAPLAQSSPPAGPLVHAAVQALAFLSWSSEDPLFPTPLSAVERRIGELFGSPMDLFA